MCVLLNFILFIFFGSNSKLIKIYAFIIRSHLAEFNVWYLAHMELVIKIYQFPLHNTKLVVSGINPAFSSLRVMVDTLPGQISHEVITVFVSLNAFLFFAFIFIKSFFVNITGKPSFAMIFFRWFSIWTLFFF